MEGAKSHVVPVRKMKVCSMADKAPRPGLVGRERHGDMKESNPAKLGRAIWARLDSLQ